MATQRRRALAGGLLLLVVAVGVRLPGLWSRGIWYDEALSLLTSAGRFAPEWPRLPEPAAAGQKNLAGQPSLSEIARGYREILHPPLYFCVLSLWRRAAGPSLEAARALSLLFSVAAVLVLYDLLRRAGCEHPAAAAGFYALATGAVHNGHEARSYALTELLIVAAALGAWLAVEWAPKRRLAAAAGAVAMALAGGAAVHAHYFALLSVAGLLAWFLWRTWKLSPALGLLAPAMAGALALWALLSPLSVLLGGFESGQFAGFVGLLPEVRELLTMNAQQIGIALSRSGGPVGETGEVLGDLVAAAALLILAGLALVRLWGREPRQLLTLLATLAVAPTLGILLLDAVFRKQLHEARYLSFGTPALAALLCCGALGLLRWRRSVGVLLFVGLLALQASRINWGVERCVRDQTGSLTRGLVSIAEGVAAPSRLFVVAAGFGRGDPAAWWYELDAATPAVVFDASTDLDRLLAVIDRYVDVWITLSTDKATVTVERELIRRLEATGRFLCVFRQQNAWHYVRLRPGAEPRPPAAGP